MFCLSEFCFSKIACFNITSRSGTALTIGAGLLVFIAGCGSSGDQKSARLKDMQYTLENLVDEVAGRVKESDRRLALMAQKQGGDNDVSPVSEDGSDRSRGPGGNPFTIESIGADVAVKLARISDLDPETAVDDLAKNLKLKGVEQEKIDKLITAIRDKQAKLSEGVADATDESPIGGR